MSRRYALVSAIECGDGAGVKMQWRQEFPNELINTERWTKLKNSAVDSLLLQPTTFN